MFQRRTTGSVVCPSCGSLVGVRDEKCYTCGRANPGLWGFAPMLRRFGADLGFAPLVISASGLLYLLTLLVSGSSIFQMHGLFSILSPSVEALFVFGASGALPVFGGGRWWTVLSAGWLHASLLHIGFNMLWVRDLGPATADIVGPSRTVIIYTVSGVCGFLLSSFAGRFLPDLVLFHGAQFTVGASASIFGLFGALVHYGRMSGSSYVREQAVRYAVIMFLFGVFMPGGGVDNYAHAGGFAGGYLTSAFFNPLTRERGDHVIIAVACLAVSFLAVLFSVLTLIR